MLTRSTYQQLVDASAIFSETDLHGNITYVNEKFCEISGYTESELLDENHRILKSGHHAPDFYKKLWKTIANGKTWKGDICNRRKDGTIYWVDSTIQPIFDDESQKITGYASIRFDVTERYRLLRKIEFIANHDDLTRLPNRFSFQEKFNEAIERSKKNGQQIALCILDLDFFKVVNDEFGHDVGDKLLISVSGRIRSMLRSGDTLARLGGDEFALLIPNVHTEHDVKEIIHRLAPVFESNYKINGIDIATTFSGGVTLYPSDDSTPEVLMRHADQALYVAKRSGRNKIVFFDPDDAKDHIQHQLLIQELQYAMSNGNLFLHYQPKIRLDTETVGGLEALLRWNHPTRGLIPPLDYLPIIEKTSFAEDIGEWVINEALRFIDISITEKWALPISVNICTKHFQSQDFPDILKSILSQHPNIDPHLLDLEILESTAVEDFTPAQNNIIACRELGVTLSLDDFGTGYSSLSYLKNLKVQNIKIDRSFIRDILVDESDLTLTKSIVDLGRNFKLNVVAEGVESLDQITVLKSLQCNEVQGFAIAKPMPANEVRSWIARFKNRKHPFTM